MCVNCCLTSPLRLPTYLWSPCCVRYCEHAPAERAVVHTLCWPCPMQVVAPAARSLNNKLAVNALWAFGLAGHLGEDVYG